MVKSVGEFAWKVLVLWVMIPSLLIACTPQSASTVAATGEKGAAAKTSPLEGRPSNTASPPFIPPAAAEDGISVAIVGACSDGGNTILHLETTLDSNYWQLTEEDFYPVGKTYFETAIVLFENEILYSSFSSGKRDEPQFDPQNQTLTVSQTFVFPQVPIPDSKFRLTAQVTLLDLPSNFLPPTPMDFLEPGIVEIPKQFETTFDMTPCKE